MRKRYLWLILPFIGTLLPWIYNRSGPALLGLPFFYWYQLAWVVATALILGAIVVTSERADDV